MNNLDVSSDQLTAMDEVDEPSLSVDLNTTESKHITKRDFLITAFGLFSFGLIGLILDSALLDGGITKTLLRMQSDEAFRKKTLETIQQGRAGDKLQEFFSEKMHTYESRCELGDQVFCREEILDRGFDDYQVRPMILGDEQTDNLILVAKYKDNVRPLETKYTRWDKTNLVETQRQHGDFFTIPSSLVALRDDVRSLALYSSYLVGDKVQTYAEDQIEYSSGAIVLDNNGCIHVADRTELMDYSVGTNCVAIQSYALAVDSNSLASDLRSLESMSYGMSGTALQGRINAGFVVTLRDSANNNSETLIISPYQHYNADLHEADAGSDWYMGISVEQAVSICNQLAGERGYDRFTFVVPDPHYMHSKMMGPQVLRVKDAERCMVRQFGYDCDADLQESLDRSGFVPPIFLAAML